MTTILKLNPLRRSPQRSPAGDLEVDVHQVVPVAVEGDPANAEAVQVGDGVSGARVELKRALEEVVLVLELDRRRGIACTARGESCWSCSGLAAVLAARPSGYLRSCSHLG